MKKPKSIDGRLAAGKPKLNLDAWSVGLHDFLGFSDGTRLGIDRKRPRGDGRRFYVDVRGCVATIEDRRWSEARRGAFCEFRVYRRRFKTLAAALEVFIERSDPDESNIEIDRLWAFALLSGLTEARGARIEALLWGTAK